MLQFDLTRSNLAQLLSAQRKCNSCTGPSKTFLSSHRRPEVYSQIRKRSNAVKFLDFCPGWRMSAGKRIREGWKSRSCAFSQWHHSSETGHGQWRSERGTHWHGKKMEEEVVGHGELGFRVQKFFNFYFLLHFSGNTNGEESINRISFLVFNVTRFVFSIVSCTSMAED